MPIAFSELVRLGRTAWTRQSTIEVTKRDIHLFAESTGDYNPIHCDDEKAQEHGLPCAIAHGDWIDSALPKFIGFWEELISLSSQGIIIFNVKKECTYKLPVPIGSHLYAELQVLEYKVLARAAMLSLGFRILIEGHATKVPAASGLRMLHIRRTIVPCI